MFDTNDNKMENFKIGAMFTIVFVTMVTCAVLSIINIKSANYSFDNIERSNISYSEKLEVSTDSLTQQKLIEGSMDTFLNQIAEPVLVPVPIKKSNSK